MQMILEVAHIKDPQEKHFWRSRALFKLDVTG